MEYFRGCRPCRSTPIYRRICLRAYLCRRSQIRREAPVPRTHTWPPPPPPVGVCVSACSPVNAKGCRPRRGWRPGVEAITVTKLPSDCRRGSGCLSWRVCRSRSLSLSHPPSPARSLPSSLARILSLARSLRSYSWFKFNCLLSAIPGSESLMMESPRSEAAASLSAPSFILRPPTTLLVASPRREKDYSRWISMEQRLHVVECVIILANCAYPILLIIFVSVLPRLRSYFSLWSFAHLTRKETYHLSWAIAFIRVSSCS